MKTSKTNLMQSLDKLQKALQYTFKDDSLLLTALTHSSYAHNNGGNNNERMEFLGDAILDFVVAEYLYQRFPNRTEGDYTLVRADVVDTNSLAREAQELGLIDYLLVSSGFLKQGVSINKNKKLYADLYESVLCAIYLDGGLDQAKRFIFKTLKKELNESMHFESSRDFKTLLKEAGEKLHFSIEYLLQKREGTDDNPTFYYSVLVNDQLAGEGYGSSIKEAQAYAAKRALKKLNLFTENYDKPN